MEGLSNLVLVHSEEYGSVSMALALKDADVVDIFKVSRYEGLFILKLNNILLASLKKTHIRIRVQNKLERPSLEGIPDMHGVIPYAEGYSQYPGGALLISHSLMEGEQTPWLVSAKQNGTGIIVVHSLVGHGNGHAVHNNDLEKRVLDVAAKEENVLKMWVMNAYLSYKLFVQKGPTFPQHAREYHPVFVV